MKISIRAITTLTTILMTTFGIQVISPAVYASVSPENEAGALTQASMFRDDAQRNKWNQEAREFDSAINELKGILQLDVETEKGSEEATKILERNVNKLQFTESKIA